MTFETVPVKVPMRFPAEVVKSKVPRTDEAQDGAQRWREGSAADQYGEAKFANLRPGRCRLYAFDGLDIFLSGRAGALQRFDTRALSVDLREGKAHQLETTVTAFDQ